MTGIATLIRDISSEMNQKIDECEQIFSSGECRELGRAY